MKKTSSGKLIKLMKINSAAAFLLGTFIKHLSTFDLNLIQIKLKFKSSHFIEWGNSRMTKI